MQISWKLLWLVVGEKNILIVLKINTKVQDVVLDLLLLQEGNLDSRLLFL